MTRIVFGLITLAAIIEGLAPGAVPSNLLPLALVVLGVIFGWTAISADDPVVFLLIALTVAAAATMPDVAGVGDGDGLLAYIPAVGGQLDAILGQIATALLAGTLSIFAKRAMGHLKGE